jgi:transcriptional regulator of arginine metabolism
MMKKRRQAAILGLVDRHPIASQEDLRGRLHALGHSVTQATLSRDIRDLGLVKQAVDGTYHRPGGETASPALTAARLQHAVVEYLTSVDRAMQMVVIRTGVGQAQPLALAIDDAGLDGVVGTVAGDDTVFMVCRDATAASRVTRQLEELGRQQGRPRGTNGKT